jgi:ketosteroid isomerase-like protein
MNTKRKTTTHIVGVIAAVLLMPSFLPSREGPTTAGSELLEVREQVWRAWFAGDTKTLENLVPAEAIVISDGEEKWKNQREVIRSSAEFHEKGGQLIRLEFPHTDVQHFGDVVIVWSSYVLETESGGKRSSSVGRATEIFVRHDGRWTNPGWHTSSTK